MRWFVQWGKVMQLLVGSFEDKLNAANASRMRRRVSASCSVDSASSLWYLDGNFMHFEQNQSESSRIKEDTYEGYTASSRPSVYN